MGDAGFLPFPDESFDGVLMECALSSCETENGSSKNAFEFPEAVRHTYPDRSLRSQSESGGSTKGPVRGILSERGFHSR